MTLDLSDVTLTDDLLSALGEIRSLRQLKAPKTGISDAGLQKLSNLTRLTLVGLWQTKITDEGFKHFPGCTNLSYLSVAGNREVKDDGLIHLAKLTKLSWLSISYTGVTDAGMSHLAKIPSLTRLDIAHTAVTDRGLDEIVNIKALKTLDLTGTNVTDAGVAKKP